MTINRRAVLGLTIGVDPAGSTSYTTLGIIVGGLKKGATKADIVDITLLSDTWKQFVPGQRDAGESTFQICYAPDETAFTTLTGLLSSTSQTAPQWLITLPNGSQGSGTVTSETFKGYVVGLSREQMVDKMMTCEVTVKHTGVPGFTGA